MKIKVILDVPNGEKCHGCKYLECFCTENVYCSIFHEELRPIDVTHYKFKRCIESEVKENASK